jgi:hypothetical protein
MLSKKRKLNEICDSEQVSKTTTRMMRLNDGTKISVTHQASLQKQVASPSPAKGQTQPAEKTTPAEKTVPSESAI